MIITSLEASVAYQSFVCEMLLDHPGALLRGCLLHLDLLLEHPGEPDHLFQNEVPDDDNPILVTL